MDTRSHACQSRHRLTLAPGGNQDNVIIGIISQLLDFDFHIFRNRQMSEGLGYICADLDTAAADHNFFSPGPGDIDNQLDSGNIGGKQSNNDTAAAVGNNFVQRLTDLFIGNGVTFFFHVGGIRQKGEDPLFTTAGKFI